MNSLKVIYKLYDVMFYIHVYTNVESQIINNITMQKNNISAVFYFITNIQKNKIINPIGISFLLKKFSNADLAITTIYQDYRGRVHLPFRFRIKIRLKF